MKIVIHLDGREILFPFGDFTCNPHDERLPLYVSTWCDENEAELQDSVASGRPSALQAAWTEYLCENFPGIHLALVETIVRALIMIAHFGDFRLVPDVGFKG